ncbi:MAG: CobW family GTP-binding protein [Candidatus Dormibacteraceae bacterium]
MTRRERLRLTVFTGFLGSGKTTLLRRALGEGRPDVAVVVNEFADAAVDQAVIRPWCARVVTVAGGCACCQRRGELLDALRGLLDDYERGTLEKLRHVVIETSGLADPLPIITAINLDPVLRHHFELGAVVTVIDGVQGEEQLGRHAEVRRQVHSADRIVVSKTDLAEPAQVKALADKLAMMGAATTDMPEEPADLLAATGGQGLAAQLEGGTHSENVVSVSIPLDRPLDWVAFGVWLSLLLHAHGRRLLRIKGIVPTGGFGSIAINAVQHAIYPPEHIDSLGVPARLVVIAQDLSPESITRSLFTFQRAVGQAS